MYDQDENAGWESIDTPPGEQSSEYRFSGESIPHRSYMDANFVPSIEEQPSPRTYYTPPVRPPERPKAKRGVGIGGLIAACLVCALLGGGVGGVLVATQLPDSYAGADYSGGKLNIADSDSGSTQTARPVSSGEMMTGSEIYSLGCAQAVGVSTEITYTNYFGMQSTSAVSGSGFVVTGDGYVVTNYHVISDAYKGNYKVSVILSNGDRLDASIVGVEEASDIAVLKINATGLSAATLGNSDKLQVGEMVYAIGNPLGELSFSMTDGIVSALDRDITTRDAVTNQATTNNMIQISAAVNEGNSGGPVYNNKGEVIGIVTAKYADTGVEGLGFAIPINDVTDIIDQLITQGYVSGKASFGIVVGDVSVAPAQYFNMAEGAYVYSVEAGSCSEKAGLKVGDIITKIGDTEIKSFSELTNAKKDYKAGDTVTLEVFRQGEYFSIIVTLDESVPASSTSGSVEPAPTPDETPGGGNGARPELPTF
ncbi:MAG: S1C family serine protease [Oscillospiraceae bacterium]|jgi:serine protease Do|nr:S1C family serine protease [Oscillospiraceae bacterium]